MKMWRSSAATTNVLEGNAGLGAIQRSSSTHFLAPNNNNNINERWPTPYINTQADKHFSKNNNNNANDAKISLQVNYRYQQQQQQQQQPQFPNVNSRERARPVSMYEQQQQQQHYYHATNNGDFVARMSPAAALGVGVTRSESLFFGNSKMEQRQLQQHHHQQQQQQQNKQRRRQSPTELVCKANKHRF